MSLSLLPHPYPYPFFPAPTPFRTSNADHLVSGCELSEKLPEPTPPPTPTPYPYPMPCTPYPVPHTPYPVPHNPQPPRSPRQRLGAFREASGARFARAAAVRRDGRTRRHRLTGAPRGPRRNGHGQIPSELPPPLPILPLLTPRPHAVIHFPLDAPHFGI